VGQQGCIVSHLREFLAANHLNTSELARRSGLHVRNQQMFDPARDTVQTYKSDILACICAFFGGMPLAILPGCGPWG
jgi:hypothetical protein